MVAKQTLQVSLTLLIEDKYFSYKQTLLDVGIEIIKQIRKKLWQIQIQLHFSFVFSPILLRLSSIEVVFNGGQIFYVQTCRQIDCANDLKDPYLSF